jgi:seryl-tRNA synthetase
MLKQINKELRQANKDMFGGKTDKAIASLQNIKKQLIEVKEADPNNPQVKSYGNKYKKLVKDLERRTGQDLGGGTLTATKASKRRICRRPQR